MKSCLVVAEKWSTVQYPAVYFVYPTNGQDRFIFQIFNSILVGA